MAYTKIPGNLIETGAITTAALDDDAVTTAKILDANITHAKLHTSMDLTGKTVTVATAAGSTNTTAAASTAFVQQELTTLIGGAPGTLDTLNELAAAINDDSNYNSTLTTALATKLPLAGGTMTGQINANSNPIINVSTLSLNGDITMTEDDKIKTVESSGGSFLQLRSDSLGVTSNSTALIGLNDIIIGAKSNNAGTGNIYFGIGSENRTSGWTDTLTIAESGNVGIGTNAPGANLHVKDVTGEAKILIQAGSNTSSAVLQFGDSVDSSRGGIEYTSTDDMVFSTNNMAGAMRIRYTGNVGIGTNNPNGRLQFDNGIDTRKIVLYEGANNNYQFYGFGVEGSTLVYSTYTNTDDHVFFSGASASSRNELMRIGGNGNVGIGTNNPNDILDIRKANSQLRLTDSDDSKFVQFSYSGGKLIIRNNSTNTTTNQLTLMENGNVGIGTINPTAPLDVSEEIGSNIAQTSTHTYSNNRNWAMKTNNYGSTNWGGWVLEQSTSSGGTPSVARIGVHLNGNVGINMGGDASTSLTDKNPATALHVGGDITVGSADAVGTSGTAAIRFQNDNERSRITSNYASGGGGQMGFWTDTTGGTLVQRVTIKNDGTKVTNNVREYYERIYLTNNVAYTFDINVRSIGASGQVLEVFAGYTHYATSYGAVIKQIWTHRSTAQSNVVIVNNTVSQSTGNGGAWSFTYVDADTVRLTKSAGTYGGSGWGYILVRSPD